MQSFSGSITPQPLSWDQLNDEINSLCNKLQKIRRDTSREIALLQQEKSKLLSEIRKQNTVISQIARPVREVFAKCLENKTPTFSGERENETRIYKSSFDLDD